MRLFKPKKPGGRQRFGLGDAVELAARPVVIAVKSVSGVDLSNCAGCKKRKEKYNKASDAIVDTVLEIIGKKGNNDDEAKNVS